ncbi:MAG: hypothetical protein [Bacteriophage sp.]|nr:MAG: hypothetical protein [Bacteriophage sp.]
MAYVSTAWGRPVQGVSQQPDRVRQEGQCTQQINGIPDVVKGLTKRPSTEFIKEVIAVALSPNSSFHSYDRGDEQYFMFVQPGSNQLRVYNTNGVEQVVNHTHGSYLNNSRPDLNLDFTTVADYTFITNKTVPVTMTSEKSPLPSRMGIVYCQYATYGKIYAILANGVVIASYETPDGSDSTHIKNVATDFIANELYNDISANADYTASLHNNVLWIERIDGADFKLTTSDSQKGEDLIAAKGSIRTTTQLPPIAPDGFTLRITGAGKSSKDDYWLKASNSNESSIKWLETVEPGIPIKFNTDTMPHVLVRESVNSSGIATFTFRPGEYEEREVGGSDSNPLPSFIDEDNPAVIQATGVFQNRLFFLSGESFITSRSNLFFNFWRETTQTAAATDPLDGYADTDRVNNLYNYEILNGDLAIFSDNAQFVIDGSRPITKDNLTLRQVTAYPSEVSVGPQAAGENVFFAYDAAGYVGVRELFTDNYTDTKKAYPVTDYVSKFIPGKCKQLLASPNLNTMIVRTESDLSRLYNYDWLWQDNQKVQSAWHYWQMDGEVLYVFYIEDILFVVYRVGDKTYLDSLHMLNDPETLGLEYSTKLDHKYKTQAMYNPLTGKYNFTLPYGRDDLVHTLSDGCHEGDRGSSFIATYLGDGLWESSEDLSPDKFKVSIISGVKYRFSYVPTQPVVKDFRDRVIGLSSIIMSNLFIHYEITGDIYVTASPKDGRPRDYHFSGRYMGTAENLVGSPILANGTYRVPIRQRAEDMRIEIWSDTHYPLTIRDMEMDGTFHQRGQRI